mmetsp:Transcript_6947/g.16193  ORF Transcript_6947/g.16193 Transcript_6947/m.16193 type:complete len:126 (-) Transcript_6947:201-578(-)
MPSADETTAGSSASATEASSGAGTVPNCVVEVGFTGAGMPTSPPAPEPLVPPSPPCMRSEAATVDNVSASGSFTATSASSAAGEADAITVIATSAGIAESSCGDMGSAEGANAVSAGSSLAASGE